MVRSNISFFMFLASPSALTIAKRRAPLRRQPVSPEFSSSAFTKCRDMAGFTCYTLNMPVWFSAFTFSNVLVDIAYALLDPRIRYGTD